MINEEFFNKLEEVYNNFIPEDYKGEVEIGFCSEEEKVDKIISEMEILCLGGVIRKVPIGEELQCVKFVGLAKELDYLLILATCAEYFEKRDLIYYYNAETTRQIAYM